MDTAATGQPSTALRWLAALTLLGLCLALIPLVGDPSIDALHTLSLLIVALATYAWLLFPLSGSLLLSLVALLCLGWAWAVRQSSLLGFDVAAGGILVVVAAVQRRWRARRALRLQQILDDLQEEQTVKAQAIAAAQQAREALQKKLGRYTQLQTIAEELSSMTELDAIAQSAVERAFTLIGKSDVCLLFVVDPERQELSLCASKKREAIASIRAKHGDQFDRHVLRSHRPLLVNDVRRDFRFTVAAASERAVGSVIACPLLVGQSPEGVLRLDAAQAGAYTQDDLRFLDILLDLIATAVTNAKLFARTQQLAMTDGLTGLTLRRPFLEQLARELTRAQRSREAASVLMLDVDEFKSYNDAFGHTAGDLILKSVAEVLRTVVPPGGVAARYGGEEFAVLLPRLSRPQAGDVAERIRSLVEQQTHVAERSQVRVAHELRRAGEAGRVTAAGPVWRGVTVSIGVATFPEDAQVDLELIRVADQRLYQAKRSGRNLVCSA